MKTIGAATLDQRGIALLGAIMLVLIMSLLGATLLNLAAQERVNAGAGKMAVMTQQLADAAIELTVLMFHNPGIVPPRLAEALSKRVKNAAGISSFFDQAGHSQFNGTAAQPDVVFNAGESADDHLLNDPQTGLFHAMQQSGVIEELKIYGPSRPGLLCTVDATVSSRINPSIRQSVTMQLSALEVPPLRAAVQVGQSLGRPQPGSESPVRVHWGDLKVEGDLALQRTDDLPVKTGLTAPTGQGYDDTALREDQWTEVWVGGQIELSQLSAGQTSPPVMPPNVHLKQSPVPGVHLDQWKYDQLKAIAQRYGQYFGIDRDGLLYPQGIIVPGQGISPDTLLQSRTVGDLQGLIFIDTLDQTAPRADNLGTVTIHGGYLEGLVVVEGHVLLSPGATGQSLSVLSPPLGVGSAGSRASVTLSQIHLNGVLYAAGNVTVSGKARVFGAIAAGGTVASGGGGGSLEVWYNHDYAQGLYRGLPLVHPAPGTWMAKY